MNSTQRDRAAKIMYDAPKHPEGTRRRPLRDVDHDEHSLATRRRQLVLERKSGA